MAAIVRRCTIADLESAPNLSAVLSEYEIESSMREFGRACVQVEMYRGMEAAGFLHPIAAFDENQLNGFILPIVMTVPHYGVLAATVESFFVPKEFRRQGIGLLLRAEAEKLAKELGAKALLLSAPDMSILDRVMKLSPYRHSNNVYVRAL